MSSLVRPGIIFALLICPVAAGIILNYFQPSDSVYMLGVYAVWSIGIPFTLFTGMLSSNLDKRKTGTTSPTILGYVIPTVISVFLLVLLALLSNVG